MSYTISFAATLTLIASHKFTQTYGFNKAARVWRACTNELCEEVMDLRRVLARTKQYFSEGLSESSSKVCACLCVVWLCVLKTRMKWCVLARTKQYFSEGLSESSSKARCLSLLVCLSFRV